MREYFAVNKFRQGRYLWMPVVLLLVLMPVGAAAEQAVPKPPVPVDVPAKKQIFKPGTPEAAVALLLDIHFTEKGRNPNEWIPVLSPYFADVDDRRCRQSAIVRNYRVVGGGYADTGGVTPGAQRIYLVTVETEVLALMTGTRPKTPRHKGFCGWKDLEIVNRETGQTEKVGDVLMDDSGAVPSHYERFGRKGMTFVSGTVTSYVVEPTRRLWRFRIPLIYRETMDEKISVVNGKIVSKKVPLRGWMFVSPFAPSILSADDELQTYIRIRKDNLQKLADCEGRGKPPGPETQSSFCSPSWLESYRSPTIDPTIDFFRSLLNSHTQAGEP